MFPYLFFFAHGDLQKELLIGPFVKCFKADTLRRFDWQISKAQIFKEVLSIEGFVKIALR